VLALDLLAGVHETQRIVGDRCTEQIIRIVVKQVNFPVVGRLLLDCFHACRTGVVTVTFIVDIVSCLCPETLVLGR
jgi:hypothetical protein